MKITKLLLLISAVFLFFVCPSCQRDEYNGLPGPDPVGEKVQVTINGRVLDEQQLPIAGAQVKAGHHTAQTDLNGDFQITNVTVDGNASSVKVEKSGYFKGSRTFKAIKGSSHFVSIQLIKKNNAGTFSSVAGGNITVPNGGEIQFEAGAVVNARTNTVYTGDVIVSAFLLDPTAGNFLEIMPGDLRGIDQDNKEVGLQSFGMMAVEMSDPSGEPLQLVKGKPATIRFPIAAAQLASAPATIAFWSFNDSTGLWKQEGMAVRQGNEYIGKASHFSFWNCDAPFPLSNFKATLKDQHDQPLKVVKVVIQDATDMYGATGYSYTDTAGVISGLVPAGKKLKLSVFGKCNNVIEEKEIGPISGTVDLGLITINVPLNSQVTFTGEVLNCNGNPVQNGFVDINIDGMNQRAPIVNGVLNYSFLRCGSNEVKALIRATDIGANHIGELQEVNVNGPSVSVGQIPVCDNSLDAYLIYTLDTMYRQFIPPVDSVRMISFQTFHRIAYETKDTSNNFVLEFSSDAAETSFTPLSCYIRVRKKFHTNSDMPQLILKIDEFGPPGEYAAGTVSGNLRDLSGAVYPISCRFRIRRTP